MVSSLAAQLSQQTSLNAERLKSKSRHRHYGYSYLFSDQEAGQHDLDSIFSLAQNGYTALLALKPSIAQHGGDELFSSSARTIDRTVLPRDQVRAIHTSIGQFLRSISEYILLSPTDKVVEWLVRRFRVNEFDVPLVLEAFLPFHESTQFARMLSILSIEPNSMWSFLKPYKKAAKALSRTDLINAMTKDVDLARFIASVLPNSLEQQTAHTTLMNFNTSVMVEYTTRLKVLDEGILGFLLPSVSRSIELTSGKDCILGGFVVLTSMCQRCQLTKKALHTILTAIAQCGPQVTTSNLLTTLIAISATQPNLDFLPAQFLDSLEQTRLLAESIPPTLWWKGSEKFYLPLFASMDRTTLCKWAPVANSIANATSASGSFIQRLTSIVLSRFFSVLAEDDITEDDDILMSVLSNLYQRHPDAFKAAASAMPEETAPKVTRMITAFALGVSANDEVDNLLAAQSEDALVRSSGLLQVLSAIPAHQSDEEFMKSARDVINTNLAHSDDLSILNVLYSSPTTLLQILPDKETLFRTILKAIRAASGQSHSHAQSQPRSRIRLHLEFLSGPFCEAFPELKERIFEEAFVPFLLLTRPRAKLGRVVWEVLLRPGEDGGVPASILLTHPLILGCNDELLPLLESDQTASNAQLAAINLGVANKVAQNILTANEYDKYLDFFVSRVNHQDSNISIFALLVVRALLNVLSTNQQQQLDAACKVLKNLDLDNLEALKDVLTDAQTLAEFVAYESFGETIIIKPNSLTTRRRLHASIIALLPGIPKPNNCQIHWLQPNGENGNPDSTDTRGDRFVQLSRTLYGLANTSSSLHTLSTNMLRAMFVNMKEDSLLFLAGVWTSVIKSDDLAATNIQLSSLAHAKAFLLAHLNKDENTPDNIDFQVIVPSLLIVLHSSDRRVRTAALDNLKLISEACGAGAQRTAVYAVDQVYGKASANVQLMDLLDLGQYLTSIIEKQGSLIVDPNYLRILHDEILGRHSGGKKRERAYRQRVLCYLLSHVLAWDNVQARLILLRSLEGVRHSAKLSLLLPLVRESVQDRHSEGASKHLNENETEEYYRIVFSLFDTTSSDLVNGDDGGVIALFEEALGLCVDPDANPAIRFAPLLQLRKVFFGALNAENKLRIATTMLGFALSNEGLASPKIKEALPDFVRDKDVILRLLVALSPTLVSPEHPNKRIRLDSAAESTSSTDDRIPKLTILAEAVVSRPPEATFELISCVLDVLKKLLAHHDRRKTENDYVEQLLLSVLEECINHVPEGKPASGVLGIDVLTDIIRSTDNPQTFQQALLVISSIARLIPESVLHHVLPIFTFMGSNVFHRDDTYSFRVVQKTVDSIVPLMAKSLKDNHQTSLELYSAARSFLRIFTDASTHIPRHRRTQFFLHLVQVLGPDDFLAPICMLLVDKNANRILKQHDDEAMYTLSLPLSLLQHQDPAPRSKVLVECMKECERLLSRLLPGEGDRPAFLEPTFRDDHSSPSLSSTKKQVIALLTFVGYGVKPSTAKGRRVEQHLEHASIRKLLKILVAVSSTQVLSTTGEQIDIKAVARHSLGKTLGVIPAAEFIASIETLLASEDPKVLQASLELLAERLPLISTNTRASSLAAILVIIERLRLLLADIAISSYVLEALYAVCDTQLPSEDGPLSKVVPNVVEACTHNESATQALKVLGKLTSKLGPRLIPYIGSIVEVVSTQARGATSSRPQNIAVAMQVYQNLLESVPMFIGKELGAIVISCIEASASSVEGEMPDVLLTVSEKLPSKTLLSTLSQLWSSEYKANTRVVNLETFFKLVKRSIVAAPRSEVMERVKSLFAFLLEALDLRATLRKPDVQAVELSVIQAFTELVTKLNEATFKPLFRRFFDWAFTSGNPTRKTSFCYVMATLFEIFKGILTPYMTTILGPITELLEEYEALKLQDSDLWIGALAMLRACLENDEGVFWRDDRLEALLPRLVKQIPIMPVEESTPLYTCLVSFSETVSRDELLKALNLALLMETRSEESRVQLIALGAVSEVWKRGGRRLAFCVPETITFVEDLAESENDQVAKESRKFKKVMETANGGQAIEAMDL